MARLARVVVPDIPHHIIQRGNRRQATFFESGDYQQYIGLMSEWCYRSKVEIWAYCLMGNHIHLVAVPTDQKGLVGGIGEAHRRYTRMINFRKSWRGHLWQGRFLSYPMDERYLLSAVRYIENNPVKAGICKRAEDYFWSSARAHKNGKDDRLVKVKPILERVGNWDEYILQEIKAEEEKLIKRHEYTGRPLGSVKFIKEVERRLKRKLTKRKPGPKSDN